MEIKKCYFKEYYVYYGNYMKENAMGGLCSKHDAI
jgi:hypothetical protein